MSTYDAEPFVVALDLESERNAKDTAALLREIIGHWPYGRTHFAGGSSHLRMLADQIEAQVKPPRIPEPLDTGSIVCATRGLLWCRADDGSWVCLSDGYAGDTTVWPNLVDPVLFRDGVEDQS